MIILLFPFIVYISINEVVHPPIHTCICLFCTLLVFPQPSQYTVLCISAFFSLKYLYLCTPFLYCIYSDTQIILSLCFMFNAAVPQGITEVILPYLFYWLTHLCAYMLYCCMATRERCTPQVLEHEKAVARK